MDNFDLMDMFEDFKENFSDMFESDEEIVEAFKQIIELQFLDDSEMTDEEESMQLYYQSQTANNNQIRIELLEDALALDSNNFFAQIDMILYTSNASDLRHNFLQLYIKINQEWKKETPQHGWYNHEERVYLIAIFLIAETFLKMGLLKDAEVIYENLYEINEHDNLGARYSLMKIYVLTLSYEKALTLYSANEIYEIEDQMVFPMLLVSILQGETTKANELFEQFKELNPEGVEFFQDVEFDFESITEYFDLEAIKTNSIESLAATLQDLLPMFLHSDYLYEWLHEKAGPRTNFSYDREIFLANIMDNPLFENLQSDKKEILAFNGLHSLEEFSEVTKTEVLKIRGIGQRTIETLVENGVVFKED